MKYAGDHPTYECTKPNTIPAKCINCDGKHTARNINCPNNPNNPSKQQTLVQPKNTVPYQSFADIVKRNKENQPTSD